jgi:hypothetical protein
MFANHATGTIAFINGASECAQVHDENVQLLRTHRSRSKYPSTPRGSSFADLFERLVRTRSDLDPHDTHAFRKDTQRGAVKSASRVPSAGKGPSKLSCGAPNSKCISIHKP